MFCNPGLDRVKTLCRALGDPQDRLKFIHVAGTNGKGSFCAMTDSILRAQGYKVGLFTSPYIMEFGERMRVDGENISESELCDLVEKVRPIADAMEDKPTEFELITAIAFLYFANHHCDYVVLECGLGGRLDATNVIKTPILSIITGIALDHTAFLGDTVEKIAAEKAGLIKDGRPVLFGGEGESTYSVIREAAQKEGSRCYRTDYEKLQIKEATLSGTCFDFGAWHDIKIALLGLYQPRNAASVLTAVDILRDGGLDISDCAVRDGLLSARWQARFEIIEKEPLIIFDGAHNPEGIDSAVRSIKHYFSDKVYVLTGVLKDKDYGYIASRLSEIASVAFVMTPDNPRALPAKDYAAVLSENGVECFVCDGAAEAFAAAKKKASADGMPLVCLGSLYTYCQII